MGTLVIIKADAQQGMSMYPRVMPGAILLLDRHYNSLTPFRKGESSIFAVRKDGTAPSSMLRLRTGT